MHLAGASCAPRWAAFHLEYPSDASVSRSTATATGLPLRVESNPNERASAFAPSVLRYVFLHTSVPTWMHSVHAPTLSGGIMVKVAETSCVSAILGTPKKKLRTSTPKSRNPRHFRQGFGKSATQTGVLVNLSRNWFTVNAFFRTARNSPRLTDSFFSARPQNAGEADRHVFPERSPYRRRPGRMRSL